jgi:hypothetical protein
MFPWELGEFVVEELIVQVIPQAQDEVHLATPVS